MPSAPGGIPELHRGLPPAHGRHQQHRRQLLEGPRDPRRDRPRLQQDHRRHRPVQGTRLGQVLGLVARGQDPLQHPSRAQVRVHRRGLQDMDLRRWRSYDALFDTNMGAYIPEGINLWTKIYTWQYFQEERLGRIHQEERAHRAGSREDHRERFEQERQQVPQAVQGDPRRTTRFGTATSG